LNSDDPEEQLYEEVAGDLYWNSTVRIQTSSMVPVASASAKRAAFHVPTIMDSSRRTIEATDLFAHAPRPDPRDQDKLAETPRD